MLLLLLTEVSFMGEERRLQIGFSYCRYGVWLIEPRSGIVQGVSAAWMIEERHFLIGGVLVSSRWLLAFCSIQSAELASSIDNASRILVSSRPSFYGLKCHSDSLRFAFNSHSPLCPLAFSALGSLVALIRLELGFSAALHGWGVCIRMPQDILFATIVSVHSPHCSILETLITTDRSLICGLDWGCNQLFASHWVLMIHWLHHLILDHV